MSGLAPTLPLRSGAEIPVLGIGTSPLKGAESATQVRTALEVGYRLIDTAENYRNEDAVGQALRDSGIDRSEVFITTKFNRRWHSVDGVRKAYEASLKRLGVDVDLLLVHWPNPDQDRYVDALRGLDALFKETGLRAIGTSNFKPAHLQRVLDETGITPDVNQIQLSPYSTRAESRGYHEAHGIATESWSPLGASGDELRSDPAITAIAKVHGKSPTQIVLRWHIQLGLVVIPRSSNPSRIAENIDVFDFELSEQEMNAISELDRGESRCHRFRSVWPLARRWGTDIVGSVRSRLIQSPRRTRCADACDHHACHCQPLHQAEEFPEQDHCGERGRRRLQAHQNAEDTWRDAA
jgi:2,5-diketo-D-gluconate reductase A